MTATADINVGRKPVTTDGKQTLPIFAAIGRLHITVIAALGTFTFGWLFTGDYPWLVTAVCGLDWYVVNLFNRIADLEEDRANAITGTHFVGRNRRRLLGLGCALLLASIVGMHFLNPRITVLRIAYHLLGAFYNWPLLPGGRRLKQLYFWKNTMSGVGFLITLFGYPLATMGWGHGFQGFPPGIAWATVSFSAAFFFLFELSYEVIYDLRDVKGDALAGIETYPVVHGEDMAVYIADGLIFSSMAVLVVGYVFLFVPWRIFILIAAPPIQCLVYKRALRRGISAKDCIMLTWLGALLLFIYHLWVLAGLPGVGL
jgi:4-hydroxybenzoate polyprenyltransferase